MREVARIKSPELFLGVVRILKVKFLGKDGEARDFSELFEDVMKAYAAAKPKFKRELLTILRDANGFQGGVEDGNSTEDTETQS